MTAQHMENGFLLAPRCRSGLRYDSDVIFDCLKNTRFGRGEAVFARTKFFSDYLRPLVQIGGWGTGDSAVTGISFVNTHYFRKAMSILG